MSYELYAGRHKFGWTMSGWPWVLKSAVKHGWEPTGTGPPDGILKKDWSGTYTSNDGQLVYAGDARRLAAAVQRFLDATATQQKQKNKKHTSTNTPPWDTEEGKRDHLEDFIEFCRRGSFRIG